MKKEAATILSFSHLKRDPFTYFTPKLKQKQSLQQNQPGTLLLFQLPPLHHSFGSLFNLVPCMCCGSTLLVILIPFPCIISSWVSIFF